MSTGNVAYQDERLTITINRELAQDRRIMTLALNDGPLLVTMTPEVADQVGFRDRGVVTADRLQTHMAQAGIELNGADALHYFSADEQDRLLGAPIPSHVRQLTCRDEETFSAFERAVPADDMDEAFVELGHWAVFGAFVDDQLGSAASMYAWGESQLMDIGVVTLPQARGHGLGRAVVRALCQHALEQGMTPQYRCQLDNHASLALARSVGMSLFGAWDVISPTSPS